MVIHHTDHLSALSKNADIKGRANVISEKMRSIKLKMQRNNPILPVAVSSICETMTNLKVESLKNCQVPNGHLQRFLNKVETFEVDDEVEFQEHTLHGSLEGTPRRGGIRTSSFQSSKEEAIQLYLTGLTERFGNFISKPCDATNLPNIVPPKLATAYLSLMSMHGQVA